MVEPFERKHVVGRVTVDVNEGVQLDVGLDCPYKLLVVAALGQDQTNLADVLQQTEDTYLPGGATAPLAFAHATEVGLVGFYVPVQL